VLLEPFTQRRWFKLSRLLRAVAVTAVLALFGTLVWHLVTRRDGSAFIAALHHKRPPPAPRFDLPVLWHQGDAWPRGLATVAKGNRVALADLRGRTVVVNFWASWCPPCKRETPLLVQSAWQHAGKVVFLGINVQDLPGPARKFLIHYAVPYVSAEDRDTHTSDAYALAGLPETYVIDRRGRVVAHDTGELTSTALEDALAKAAK
jgi:cytochrome c biogenesis protein CcmG, thiol:disulfide interchange protein DsbE